jgi:hypothetical protein
MHVVSGSHQTTTDNGKPKENKASDDCERENQNHDYT